MARVVVALIALALMLGSALTAGASVSEPGTEVRSVEGTIHNITVDGGGDPVQELGDPLAVVTAVEVDGEYYELPGELTDTLATGDVVEVTVASDAGLAIEDALTLAAAGEVDEAEVLAVEETGESASEEATLAEGTVAHSLTVLPVYWSTGPSIEDDTTSLRTLANSTRDYWQSQSDGDLTIPTISVRGWVQVSAPSSCSTSEMSDLYSDALDAHGVASPTGNRHVVVYFPEWSRCGWAGMASVGGGMIWINGTLVSDVLTHEYGHNLGLGHANTMTCTASGSRVPLTNPFSSCTSIEYQDYADVMGTGMSNKTTGSLNTALADHLGFVALTDVTNVSSSGVTKDLAPLSEVSELRALRMSISGGQLYVDYRPAVGRDTRWSGWAGVQVHVKTVDGAGIPSSYLLNMQPASGDFTSPSTVRPQLPSGSSWEVPGVGRTITVVSAGSVARVTVAGTLAGSGDDLVTRYVERVYEDLFGRSVDPTGLQTWTTKLLNGTPRIAVANGITYSREYRSGLITESYQTYLGRAPDGPGLENWLRAMDGGMTIQQMEAGFLASAEYYAKAGSTSAGWVRKLYTDVLGRSAAASEVAHWVGRLASGTSRNQVAMGFLLSTEHLTTVIDGYYVELLGRHIDSTGKATWVTKIQNGNRVEAIIGGIIASEEYYTKS